MPNQSALWRLDGANSTLLVIEDQDVPRLLWFGQCLGDALSAEQLLAHDNTALAFGGLDAVVPLSLFPQASGAYAGSPALNAHRHGQQFAHALITEKVAYLSDTQGVDIHFSDPIAPVTRKAQPDSANQQGLSIKLSDKSAGMDVHILITLDHASDVVTLSTSLRNTGTAPLVVDWLASATVPIPDSYQECLTQHGRWGLENQTYRRCISPGRIDISNLHGRTSHEHAPALVCGTSGFNHDEGDVLFAQFGFSGNFSLRVERLSDGTGALQTGVLYLPGECILAPDEQVTTPPTHITRTRGMNTGTQRFHRYTRNCILPAWTRSPRPIHANSWEALYFNHDHEELRALIKAAADVGAERFVLDDGWFRHRRDDTAGLGDWYVDEGVYPEGLSSIVDHIREHGMQFGLWFEPEMVNPDSDLYRAHPEWALHLENVSTPLARNQLVLDIARDDVSDYLFERISSLVREYEIDYIKWDHNRDLILPGNGSQARAAKQPPALYRLLQRILQACPALEIETCSSGGARCDLGVLRHTGRVWASDNIDPVERASIQTGFLRFFPPEIMGAHVGHEHAHLTGRVTGLHTRAIVALQGQFGFELDARKLDEQDTSALQHYTQLYKSHREWLGHASYWQLTTTCEELVASGNVAEDKNKALYSVVATANLPSTRAGTLILKGLEPKASYRLQLDSINHGDIAPFNKIMPKWCNEPIITSGELLMSLGVPLPVLPPQSALLIGCYREHTV